VKAFAPCGEEEELAIRGEKALGRSLRRSGES
jgi:hypothetical protein